MTVGEPKEPWAFEGTRLANIVFLLVGMYLFFLFALFLRVFLKGRKSQLNHI